MTPATLSLSTGLGRNIDNESNKLILGIQQTTEKINKCSVVFTEIAYQLGRISHHQYKENSQDEQKLEEVTLCQVSDEAETIARTISTCAHAVSSDKTPSALKDSKAKLMFAVYVAAKNSLKTTAYVDDVVDTAVALDQIDYTRENPEDEVFVIIINQIYNAVVSQNIASSQNVGWKVGLAVWTIFALRKVKIIQDDKKIVSDSKKSFIENVFKLFNKCCWIVLDNVKMLTSLEISLVTKGLVQAKGQSRFNFERSILLLNKIKEQALYKKDFFTINEIVNTLWSYSYFDWTDKKDPSLIRRSTSGMVAIFKSKLIQEIGRLNVDQTVRIAWTFRVTNITDADIFKTIREKIDIDSKHLTPKAFTNITQSFSYIKMKDDAVLLKLLDIIQAKIKENPLFFAEKQFAEIIYAVLVKFCYRDENFNFYDKFIGMMLRHIATTEPSKWIDQHRAMLKIAITIYKAKTTDIIEDSLMNSLKKFIIVSKEVREPKHTSSLQSEVKRSLEELLKKYPGSPSLKEEYLFEDNYFSLDMAFPDYKLAGEVDGACHFDESGKYMPKNIIKETVLALRGWDLVRIRSDEWPEGNRARQSFLERKFEKFLSKFLVTTPVK